MVTVKHGPFLQAPNSDGTADSVLLFLLPHIQQPDAYLVLLTWLSRLFFSHSGLLASTDAHGPQQLLPPAAHQHPGLPEAADQPQSEFLGCPGSKAACMQKTWLAFRVVLLLDVCYH